MLNQGILGMLSVLQVYPLDIPMFIREVAAKRYSLGNYVIARQVSELPGQIFFPGIFAVIIYLLVGMAPLDDDGGGGGSSSSSDSSSGSDSSSSGSDGSEYSGAYRFVMVVLTVVLTANVSVSMGYAVGALCPTPQVALAVGPGIVLPMALFGGLLLNSDSVPVGWAWFDALSIFKYGYHNVCSKSSSAVGSPGKSIN